MDVAGYRLRDHQAGCAGPVTAHLAEVRGRPGRLVRLALLTGDAAGPGSEALVERWRTIAHPALLPITAIERDVAGLLLPSPMASARPLDHLDPGTSQLTIATLARIGRSIAAGLRALHDHGLVHGVVNGHTILLGNDGTAVLDGPWHAACVRTSPRSDTSTAPGSAGPAATEVDDVRAVAVTLLGRLEAVEPDEPSPAGDRLRRLLEDQPGRAVSAAALEHALVRWQEPLPEPSPRRDPTTPRPQRAPGPERSRAPSTPLAQAAAPSAASTTMRLPRVALAAAAIAGALILGLGIASASLRSGPAPAGSVAAPAGSVAAPAGQPPAQPPLPSPEPARPGPVDATTRPVCPDTIPPPGPGRLLLADLDGRGCRAPVRVDGSRLALTSDDGRPTEVTLDLEPGDQVRVGDLDGSGRDEVLVYRPGTGELFRFDGLAGPGEERIATGETTRWRGGTATLLPSIDGSDRLEVRGGTPA